MSIQTSEWQDICKILCLDDPTLLSEVQLAKAQPLHYYERFEDNLFERGIEDPTQVQPWLALVDGLISRHYCVELDWKMEANELAFQLGKLKSLTGLDDILFKLSQSKTTNEDALKTAANFLKEKDFCLLQLDIGSDSYPLVVVKISQQIEVERIATSLGEHTVSY